MLVSIFNDVIGPVMRGPSSSHCAAALRIGRLARDLVGEEFSQWIFGHDVVEACTAVKGRALQSLLERGDVVYLDPDMAVFGSLDEFIAELRSRVEAAVWAAERGLRAP